VYVPFGFVSKVRFGAEGFETLGFEGGLEVRNRAQELKYQHINKDKIMLNSRIILYLVGFTKITDELGN